MLIRRGGSLVELLVALAMSSLVLSAAAGSLLRQQRTSSWLGRLAGTESQMRPLSHLLSAELAPLDGSAGDVVAGQASDTAIQIRAPIISSFACDSSAGTVTLLPDDTSRVSITGRAEPPRAGDSLWSYGGDTVGWTGRAVLSVSSQRVACVDPDGAGSAYRLTVDGAGTVPPAAPLRVTRQARFTVYRAADGRWYLGLRDWSESTGRFATPQPIAGPFLRRAPGGAISGFRYFDRGGAELPVGADPASIARVRVSGLAVMPSATARDSVRHDSADVALQGRRAP